MSLTSRTLTVATIAVLLVASSSMAENWTQFRGANTDGTAVDAKLPREIAEEKNLAWKIEVPGKGWSSPVTWGNEIWLTTATPEGDEMFVLSYDATSGKQLKNIKVFENDVTRFCHPTNSFASPTPVIEDGRIYVHFGSYGTACLNTKTGEKIWERRDLECNHWRGPGSSPIVDGDNL
ncbi:MAG: PQQ-binding-like beta-propeller repeat protein, partial [Pirellulales bacterium]|nr:PQQ-binding-like beta-propeller repeat protein [Pirellulales bacterium]